MPKKTENHAQGAPASYPLRIQAIRTKGQNVRFFVYIPMPLAAALGVERRKLADERARLAGEDPAPRKPERAAEAEAGAPAGQGERGVSSAAALTASLQRQSAATLDSKH